MSRGGGIISFCGSAPAPPVSLCSRFTRSGLESATLPRDAAVVVVAVPRCDAAAAAAIALNWNRLAVTAALLPLLPLLFCFMEWVMLANGNGARVVRAPGRTNRECAPERKGRGSLGGGATTFGDRNPPLVEAAPRAKGAAPRAKEESEAVPLGPGRPVPGTGDEGPAGDEEGEPGSASPAAFCRMISLGGSP